MIKLLSQYANRGDMTTEEFELSIKELGISRKEFCEITGLTYSAVSKWHDDNRPVPTWVDSWLENFKAKKSMMEVKEVIKRSGLCDPV